MATFGFCFVILSLCYLLNINITFCIFFIFQVTCIHKNRWCIFRIEQHAGFYRRATERDNNSTHSYRVTKCTPLYRNFCWCIGNYYYTSGLTPAMPSNIRKNHRDKQSDSILKDQCCVGDAAMIRSVVPWESLSNAIGAHPKKNRLSLSMLFICYTWGFLLIIRAR